MMEILEFIFSSFWRWLGCVILIAVIADIPKGIIKFAVKKVVHSKVEDDKFVKKMKEKLGVEG